MFTGLVLGVGEVGALRLAGAEAHLDVKMPHGRSTTEWSNLVLGESIAVNGACLTVESFSASSFTAYASAETLKRTNLGQLKPGAKVNLERALRLGDRLGGHLVSGHVDCLAVILAVRRAGVSTIFRIGFPPEFGMQIIPKGSIALDGISLTVNECGPDWLEVNIIPATLGETIVNGWKTGLRINLETDLLGKYVLRSLGGVTQAEGRITLDFLRDNGF